MLCHGNPSCSYSQNRRWRWRVGCIHIPQAGHVIGSVLQMHTLSAIRLKVLPLPLTSLDQNKGPLLVWLLRAHQDMYILLEASTTTWADMHASGRTVHACMGAAGWRAQGITHLVATCVLHDWVAICIDARRVVNTLAITSNLDVKCVPAGQHTSGKDSVCRQAQHKAELQQLS
jgi:hypothetical protein